MQLVPDLYVDCICVTASRCVPFVVCRQVGVASVLHLVLADGMEDLLDGWMHEQVAHRRMRAVYTCRTRNIATELGSVHS